MLKFAKLGLVSLTLTVALPSLGEVAFQEGVHYERLPIPVETRHGDKVEVVEVFSYACVHCMNFQPIVHQWEQQLPEHVDFYRMPATFNDAWRALAQAYYTAEALGVTERVHGPIFAAIHQRGVNLAIRRAWPRSFETEAGISKDQFNQVYNSFSVRSRVQQADARGRAYRLTGTPTLIVDGAFRIDARMAGGNGAMLQVVDHLVAERRAASCAPATAPDAASGNARQCADSRRRRR
jgi:protein dithiol oxidoreductase (disulfide-forming)